MVEEVQQGPVLVGPGRTFSITGRPLGPLTSSSTTPSSVCE